MKATVKLDKRRGVMRRILTLLTVIMVLSIVAISSVADDIDHQLRSKWNEMTSFLKQGNTEKALELIHPAKRNNYAIVFQATRDKLPQITSTQVDFKVIKIYDDYAQYELIAKEKGELYSYEVVFEKAQYGKWYIKEF